MPRRTWGSVLRVPSSMPTQIRTDAVGYILRLCLVTAIYFVAGKLGLALTTLHPSATAVWPGTGVAIAAMLLLGIRMWPAVLVGAFAVNMSTAGSLVSSIGIAAGNTLEAMLAAQLVTRFANGARAFERAGHAFRYSALVALACTVSATIGVASLVFTGYAPGERLGELWLTWWLGDVGGALVLAPFIVVWSRPEAETDRFTDRLSHLAEAVLMMAIVVTMGWVVFHAGNPWAFGVALKFLFVPPLLWAAFRFGQRLQTLLIVLLTVMGVSGILRHGVPGTPWSLNEDLLVLQVFVCMIAVTKLGITALVAERRSSALALKNSSTQLREAITQLEAFSHAISHDLRSPIGTVNNCIYLLEEDYGPTLGDDGVKLLRKIQNATESATRLLDQLALYAWSGPRDLEREVVDMTSLAREAYAEVASSGYEVGEVEFVLHELPPAVGSAALIVRVFRNLLSNAIKYTRGREARRIEVRGLAGRNENAYIVSDNGVGFDPSEREAVFEPFHRLPSARSFEGSGVGLAVVAKIIRRHGGRVWAESDGTNGARFGFSLRNTEPHP